MQLIVCPLYLLFVGCRHPVSQGGWTLSCVLSSSFLLGFFNMATVLRCHSCELVISVDCTNCQHTLDINGVYSPCVAREMGADEFLLVPFPKGRLYCLPCCGMKANYVDMWHNRQQLLQKPKPCPGCLVTLLRAPLRPPVLADQTDVQPIPLPVHSITTLVGSSLPWQDPKTVGPHAGADARLLQEQQVKIALLSQKQEEMMAQLSVLLSLEHRVHQMEDRQLDDGGLQLLDQWDVVQPQKFAT